MQEHGIMELNTDGGSRKMHYAIIDGKIYTSTAKDSNKVKQIEANPVVTIDLTDKKYEAKILGEEASQQMLIQYRKKMTKMNRLISKIIGAKNPVILELCEIEG